MKSVKQPWEYILDEYIHLIGDKYKSSDLAWLCDEGIITEEQYELFKEALKIPVKFIVEDIEYEVRNKKPVGTSIHKGMIRKYFLEGKNIPATVLKDYPEIENLCTLCKGDGLSLHQTYGLTKVCERCGGNGKGPISNEIG